MIFFRFTQEENTFRLYGSIDEYSDLIGIFYHQFDHINVDLSGVHNINEYGVRSWIDLIFDFEGGVSFQNCSVISMETLNRYPKFIGPNSDVLSFKAPFVCNECAYVDEVSLQSGKNFDPEALSFELPKCKGCGQTLNKDFDESNYFEFLKLCKNAKLDSGEKPQRAKQKRKPLRTTIYGLLPKQMGGFKYSGFCENISEGGLFIQTPQFFELGSKFKIEFMVPLAEESLKVSAEVEVEWIRDENPSKNILPGVGVNFIQINDDSRQGIKEYIKGFS